ncbi:MAG: radical SAM protein [Candidatus Falkowbacteria bacterium]
MAGQNFLAKEEKIEKQKIRILFINPPWFEGSTFDELITKAPPLGLAYLAAVLEQDGFSHIRIIDMKVGEMDFNGIKEEIEKFKPDIIGLTLATGQVSSTVKIIRIAKEINSSTYCIIGGPHVSALPARTLEETGADMAVFGEGELTMLEIARAIASGKELDGIEGLVFKKKDLIKKNLPRPLIKDINTLPFPARHLLPTPEEYSKDSVIALSKIETVIMASRGCPFRCAFCDKSVFGRTLRVRNAKNVVDEIELLVKQYNVKSLRFFDDLLTAIPERVKEICHELKKRNLKIKWICEARVNTVNPEMLAIMKDAGCVEIHYGIESGNQAVLKLQQKDVTLEEIRKAVKWTNEAGIESRGYFIIGLPGDTKDTIKETIKFGRSLNLTYAGIFFYIPYPGNFVREYELEDYGQVLARSWDEYAAFEKPIFIPKGMTEKELIKYYRRAYLLMHLNIKSIINILKGIKNLTILKSYIKAFFWSAGFKK